MLPRPHTLSSSGIPRTSVSLCQRQCGDRLVYRYTGGVHADALPSKDLGPFRIPPRCIGCGLAETPLDRPIRSAGARSVDPLSAALAAESLPKTSDPGGLRTIWSFQKKKALPQGGSTGGSDGRTDRRAVARCEEDSPVSSPVGHGCFEGHSKTRPAVSNGSGHGTMRPAHAEELRHG